MQTIWQDLRYGLRMLAKSRGFTLVAVLTLTLGIGANTAIFSVVYNVLLRPLPYPESERIQQVSWSWASPGSNAFDFPQYRFCMENSRAFQDLAAFTGVGLNLSAGSEAERVRGLHVSASYFSVLGVKSVLGRSFLPEEDTGDGANVAVLSHELWERRFGANREVIGRTVLLDGKPHTVIGVMPAQFGVWQETDLWLPLAQVARSIGGGANLGVIGRLRGGVSRQQAQADLDIVTERYFAARAPSARRSDQPRPRILTHDYQQAKGSSIRGYLLILFGASGFVLLIACANVANLLLARATTRSREMAIRTALGASTGRVVRQLMTESVLLALLGAGGGILLAVWGVDWLLALSPVYVPRLSEIGVDAWALGFSVGAALLVGLLFGLAPALGVSRFNLTGALKEGGGRTSADTGRHRLRHTLAIAEIAMALLLLTGAGLMVQTVANLLMVDPGFDPRRILTVPIWLTGSQHNSTAGVANYFDAVVGRLEQIPGVEKAAVVSAGLPLQRGGNMPMRVPGGESSEPFSADYHAITPEYFRTVGISLRRGRFFSASDGAAAQPIAIVNEAFARRYLGDQDPLGQNVVIGFHEFQDATREIVGVVSDVRSYLDRPSEPTVFIPAAQAPHQITQLFESWFPTQVVVRTAGDPLGVRDAVRRALVAVDALVPLGRIRSMEEIQQRSVALERFMMSLLGLFAGLAVVLAAVGIYGVVSYSVEQRTHEIGIRMALGAQRGDVFRMVVRQGLLLAVIGAAIGLATARWLTRFVQGLLFGVTPTDPVTFGVVSVALIGIAVLACYIPARRATKVDPIVALRYE